MSSFAYFVASAERGMIVWPGEDGKPHRQALARGLDYLGAQGWELVTTMPETFLLGTLVKTQLIFKRRLGADAGEQT